MLASDTGSLPEVVGEPALLAPEGDAEAFGRRLLELLARPAERARLGQRGHDRANALFAWSKVAADFDRMYRRVVEDEQVGWSYVREPVPDRS